MNKRSEKVRLPCALVRPDATPALEVNVAIGLSMPRMNHPLLRRRVVLHTKHRAERLRSRRPDTDDAQANTLFYSAFGCVGPQWLHTDVAMRGVIA